MLSTSTGNLVLSVLLLSGTAAMLQLHFSAKRNDTVLQNFKPALSKYPAHKSCQVAQKYFICEGKRRILEDTNFHCVLLYT